ncbi:MAG: hypothetical protein IT342_20935 [Candidatus Melainabacteria bacterium]|nr:hypothetical protein [Candidatus Melainabacteria bacterium]
MAQRKPEEKSALDQILRLVNELSPEEQERVSEELKLQWLRRELGKSEEQLRRGEGIPGQAVFAELEAEYERRKAND